MRKMITARMVRLIKPKFNAVSGIIGQPRYILDIGIANDSYRECKLVFPNVTYHGLDFIDAGVSLDPGDQFFLRNLEETTALDGLDPIYDFIIANHVLEHLEHGREVFVGLCRLLAPGGMLYVEVPSIRTAYRLKAPWSYHFNDDPTHKTFYRLEDLANLAIQSSCKVLSCGPCSTWLKDLLAYPRAGIGMLQGIGYGPYLLHFQRKIDHILVKRGQ
jgi:hypothetical protein